MKKILILFTAFFFSFVQANDVVYMYPIEYEEQKDLFIKLAYPIENAFIEYNNEKYYFTDYGVLLENISRENELALFLGEIVNGESFYLLEDPIIYKHTYTTNLFIDRALYKAISSWSTNKNQDIPLDDYLKTLSTKKGIATTEILSFTQQFYNYNAPINKDNSLSENIDQIFHKSDETGPETPCHCGFVLNHYASVVPVNEEDGTSTGGYEYLNTPGIPVGRLSRIIPKYKDFESNNSKWHYWHTNEKGPAHDMKLKTNDARGQFNYQWSTHGIDNTGNNAPSPNYAYNSFQFLCVGQEFDLPDDCNCTKKFCTLYEYNSILKVMANKLKPLAKVNSAAEELAVVTLTNNSGVTVVEANRHRVYTECRGDFNFDFLVNFFELGAIIVENVTEIQDTINGDTTVIGDVPDAIRNIGDALTELVSTPLITVTGDCEDKHVSGALLRNYDCRELKANDPTTITLQSFTYLAVAGKKKWDNYAEANSDFKLQSFVLTGSQEGEDFCCSDKLGVHLFGSMDGYVSETDHHNNVLGAYFWFGPWDNFTPQGYMPIFPKTANRGYFTYEDKNRDCAPVYPKSIEFSEYFFASTETDSLIKEFPEDFSTDNFKEENGLILDFNLYPNPSNNLLNLELKNLTTNANLSIIVYDSMGKEIEVIYNNKNEENQLNLQWEALGNSLSEGLYYIIIRENNSISSSKPFLFKQ